MSVMPNMSGSQLEGTIHESGSAVNASAASGDIIKDGVEAEATGNGFSPAVEWMLSFRSNPKEYYSTDEAMKILGMSKPTILKKIKDEEISFPGSKKKQGSKKAGRYRIPRNALEDYAKKYDIVPNWKALDNFAINAPDKNSLEKSIERLRSRIEEQELEKEEANTQLENLINESVGRTLKDLNSPESLHGYIGADGEWHSLGVNEEEIKQIEEAKKHLKSISGSVLGKAEMKYEDVEMISNALSVVASQNFVMRHAGGIIASCERNMILTIKKINSIDKNIQLYKMVVLALTDLKKLAALFESVEYTSAISGCLLEESIKRLESIIVYLELKKEEANLENKETEFERQDSHNSQLDEDLENRGYFSPSFYRKQRVNQKKKQIKIIDIIMDELNHIPGLTDLLESRKKQE